MALAVVLVACNASGSPSQLPSPDTWPSPLAEYTSLAWLPDGSRYASVVTLTPTRAVHELLELTGDGEQVVELPVVEGCYTDSVGHLSALPDGRLGYVLQCESNEIAPVASVRAIDLADGRDEELARMPFVPIDYSFAPDMRSGLVARSSAICATVGWLADGGVEPLDLELSSHGATMNLSDEPLSGAADCGSFGRAHAPDWSPDGSTIGLFASPGSVGFDGVQRLEVPWDLFLIHADTLVPRVAVEEIQSAYEMRWSPDGNYLAFSAEGYDGERGTFVYEPATGDVRRIVDTPLFGLAWSPDSGSLAGLLDTEDLLDPNRWIIVVPIAEGSS